MPAILLCAPSFPADPCGSCKVLCFWIAVDVQRCNLRRVPAHDLAAEEDHKPVQSTRRPGSDASASSHRQSAAAAAGSARESSWRAVRARTGRLIQQITELSTQGNCQYGPTDPHVAQSFISPHSDK